MTRGGYQLTANFRGFVWSGHAIIGMDVADYAVGHVFLRWYAGWYKE